MLLLTISFMWKSVSPSWKKKDVYDGAIIKNHKYWPKGIPGDEIDRNFHNRDVGGVGVLEAIT